jgi:hypothetical protein
MGMGMEQLRSAEGLEAVAVPQPSWQDGAVRFRSVFIASLTVGGNLKVTQAARVI